MAVLHIRRHIDSDTLRIPELRELIGRDVEILVREVEGPDDQKPRMPSVGAEGEYPLRGSVLRYDDPFEPVAEDDWEALQ